MRMPSVGQPFELKGIKFEITKSSVSGITAKGKSEKLEIINKGNKFKLLGTRFKVVAFKYSNNKTTIKAAVMEDGDTDD